MRRSRLAAFGALSAVLLVGAATGVAPAATPPSVTGSQALVAGSPTAIACNGSVTARVTLTGQAGTTGTATDVMILVDLSGSTGEPPSKLANLKSAALDTLAALDGADGSADGSIGGGNTAGLAYYQGTTGTVMDAVGSAYGTLSGDVTNHLPAPNGGSPHGAGIAAAAGGLAAANGHAKAIVLITDGQASGGDLTAANDAAGNARTSGIKIVPIGLGTTNGDPSVTNLNGWAGNPSPTTYQAGSPGPIDKTKLIGDLGAAVSSPAAFTVTETLGSTFSATGTASTGTVTPGTGSLQWAGSLGTGQTATLDYHATRNGSNVFSTQTELVSTMGIAVTGGSATVTPPASISIDVLPCGATPIATTTCTGSACSVSGTQGGTQYALNAGTPAAGTAVTLSGLNTPAPPTGSCPGFHAHTTGAEFDIRPLTKDATFRMVIPKASLGTLKWFQTDVCLGSNLKFITAIQSLANLSPESVLIGGGTVPGRYWGLLPSIPRIDWFPGRGFVVGPWITSRSQDSAGNAVINFVVPFVSGSTGLTTDGKAGYDPKLWG
jgi:hypothetical protein